ncbi:response regulator [Marinivivus vitaminiproducens]|uniref:response regulator n=1 Tax=Marinivivus vitaminiproducens TaxID=3035935 RepID=UPI00279D7B50|nr:response regulator transcription factor [Geminicoccaceae bacterium SCSIO 64248]
MNALPHLLVVEDDPELRLMVARLLRQNGFEVSVAGEAREATALLRQRRVDLIVLDRMLPGESGLDLCKRIRRDSAVPIVMLTALGEEVDRVVGLELGADDYVTKPFGSRELIARIRAVLRRGAGARPDELRPPRALVFDGWRLDPATRQLRDPDGALVVLTGAEFDLLHVFCRNAGQVLTRDQLLDLTRGRSASPFDRSIDVLISRLRRKLRREAGQTDLICTVRGGGYLFAGTVAA